MLGYLSLDIICSLKLTVFLATLSENCTYLLNTNGNHSLFSFRQEQDKVNALDWTLLQAVMVI